MLAAVSARLRAVIAAVPLGLWSVWHVWEQWAAFGGTEAWLARMRETSRGPAIALEVLVVLALAGWALLVIADRRAGRPPMGQAPPQDQGAEGLLRRLAPTAALVSIVFLVFHVGQFWAPKMFGGATDLETWRTVTHAVGRPVVLAAYALGLTAIAVHLTAAIPGALAALGWLERPEARRGAVLVAAVCALCLWALAVQLTGWVGTGHGTLWPIAVAHTE